MTVVPVPGGYDAATYDQSGHVDFWQYIKSWKEVARDTYPRNLSNTNTEICGGPRVTITGALLTGMRHATFIICGQFAGDGSGWDIVSASACGAQQVCPNPAVPIKTLTVSGNIPFDIAANVDENQGTKFISAPASYIAGLNVTADPGPELSPSIFNTLDLYPWYIPPSLGVQSFAYTGGRQQFIEIIFRSGKITQLAAAGL